MWVPKALESVGIRKTDPVLNNQFQESTSTSNIGSNKEIETNILMKDKAGKVLLDVISESNLVGQN